MPHYVRFLKPPHLVRYGPSDSVSALITITTELGDASLAEDVELTFAVRFENAPERSLSRTVSWTASSRELRLTLGPFSIPPSAYPATVYVGMMKDANADAVTPELPAILSAWSAPFGGTAGPAAAGLLQRRLDLGNDVLSLWEETGDSISRHVWDCGLVCIAELQKMAAAPGDDRLINLFGDREDGSDADGLGFVRYEAMPLPQTIRHAAAGRYQLRALELGAGTGIVGLAVSQLCPRATVLLTDVPVARETVERNLAVHPRGKMGVKSLGAESAVMFTDLDWEWQDEDAGIPGYVRAFLMRGIDVIIVSDCTYNADSVPALVRKLRNLCWEAIRMPLAEKAPIPVLVALKRRHESEDCFFALMEQEGFAEKSRRVAAGAVELRVFELESDDP